MGDVKTAEEHWVPTGPGYPCACGHDHHGRQLYRGNVRVAHVTLYRRCDKDDCGCTEWALRMIMEEMRA